MNDLRFQIEVSWSGTGRDGAGEILTDDLAVEFSAPQFMGGRGVGTSPEELLISAVSSCYTATPFAVLHRAGLPVDSLAVAASGTVTGISGRAQFAGTLVSPTILGGDVTRRPDCEAAAHMPHDRCFIARALRHLPSKRQPRAGDRVQPPGGETQFTPRAPEGGI